QSDAKALRPLIHFRAVVRCHQGGAAKLHGHAHDHIIAARHAAFRIGRIAIAKDAAYFPAKDIGIAGHCLETVAFEEQVDHRFHMRFLPERFGLPYALNAGWQWMAKRMPEKEDNFAALSQLPARREAKMNSSRAQRFSPVGCRVIARVIWASPAEGQLADRTAGARANRSSM